MIYLVFKSLFSSFFTDSPRSTLTVTPDSPVFTGETVNLKCVIESYSNGWRIDQTHGWRYEWYKDSGENPMSQTSDHYTVNENTLSIAKPVASDQGQYWCRGQRDKKPKSSQSRSSVYLSVKGELNITVLINSLYYMNMGFRRDTESIRS